MLLFIAFNAYLIGAIVHTSQRGITVDFCDGVGFLIIITALVYTGMFYYYVVKPYFGKAIYRCALKPIGIMGGKLWSYR